MEKNIYGGFFTKEEAEEFANATSRKVTHRDYTNGIKRAVDTKRKANAMEAKLIRTAIMGALTAIHRCGDIDTALAVAEHTVTAGMEIFETTTAANTAINTNESVYEPCRKFLIEHELDN